MPRPERELARKRRFLPWVGFVVLLLLAQVWLQARQPLPYMDELYHIPAANAVCCRVVSVACEQNKLSVEWGRITTPPGAYYFGCPLCLLWRVWRYATCPPWLWRLAVGTIPLALATRELMLFPGMSAEEAITLATFLPLFFSSLLCYTDTLAFMLYVRAWRQQRGQHPTSPLQSAVFGMLASLTRQSYIVWHTFLGLTALGAAASTTAQLEIIFAHGTAGLAYVAFFVWHVLIKGGSIYLGDAERHGLSTHWSNCLYFVTTWFILAGGWRALFLQSAGNSSVRKYLAVRAEAIRQSWRRFICLTTVAAIAVRRGTCIHPFVLADNRHYVFYFFRYFIIPGNLRRYTLVPLYAVSMACWLSHLRSTGRMERLLLFSATALTLVPSRLVEPRYFIPPVVATELLAAQRQRRTLSTIRMILNLLLAFVCLWFFLERPFERTPDLHISDPSPGRFMP